MMKNHFDKFQLWNLQTCPTADDRLVKALTWTQLSQTVSKHKKINYCLVTTIILLTVAQPFASGVLSKSRMDAWHHY